MMVKKKSNLSEEYETLSQQDYSNLESSDSFSDGCSLRGFKTIIDRMRMNFNQHLLTGLIGGIIIGFGVLCGIGLILAIPERFQKGLGMILFSLVFASCMTLIVFAGGGLFTTYVVSTWVVLKKVISKRQYFQGIFTVLLGNALGTLLIVMLIYCLPVNSLTYFKDSTQTLLSKAYEFALSKMYYLYDQKTTIFQISGVKVLWAIIAAFFSGVLCNIMVSATTFLAKCSKNGVIVVFAIFCPFFFFQYLGFHQAPTNTLLIWIMLFENIFNLSTNINVIGGVAWNQFLIFTFVMWIAALWGNWLSGSFTWTIIFYYLNLPKVKLLFQYERMQYLKQLLKK